MFVKVTLNNSNSNKCNTGIVKMLIQDSRTKKKIIVLLLKVKDDVDSLNKYNELLTKNMQHEELLQRDDTLN